MPTTRNKLFSAAAVFAIAMVVGAWTTSTRGGGEDAPLSVTAMLDGYANNPPTKMQGTLCIAHGAVSHEVGEVTWLWSSTHHFNGDDRLIQDNLGFVSEWQTLEVWDDVGYASDQVFIDVSDTGEGCEG